jgi:hypothetical protein
MSWLYSQALVEEYLVDTSLDGKQFALLSGNPTQQAYCAPDKMTVFSPLSRFGMTFKPLTETRGKELLTLYLEDFRVRTSRPQEKAQELMGKDQECGEKWRGSFVKYDPNSCLWKTHQCLLLGDLEPFLETWPQWGLMQDGECWEQKPLVAHIQEIESGLLLGTPLKSDSMRIKFKKSSTLKATFGTHVNSLPYWTCANHGKIPSLQLYHWVMAWPNGWAQFKPLEMDKFQSWQQQHGDC